MLMRRQPVSPGVNPRPSLNAIEYQGSQGKLISVAGGESPALIERVTSITSSLNTVRVAGGEPPALIERTRAGVCD